MGLPRSRTLPGLLAEKAEQGAGLALVVGQERVSYRELDERVRRCASVLRALGVGHGSRIGLLCSNSVEWIEVALGAMATGASVSAFNTWVKSGDLRYLLGSSDVSVLVLSPRFGNRSMLEPLQPLLPELWSVDGGKWSSAEFPSLSHVVVLDNVSMGGDDSAGEWPTPAGALSWSAQLRDARLEQTPDEDRSSAGDTAVIFYTSGSSARPKAVPLTHYGLVENGYGIGERLGLTSEDRVFLAAPLFWSFGCANAMMATFSHGATLVMQAAFEPTEAISLLRSESCTAVYLLPHMIHRLLAAGGGPVAGLIKGLTIGRADEVRLAALDLGVANICNVYGATETYGNCCVTPWNLPLEQRATSQGPPLPGNRVRIVDPTSRGLLPSGSVGEIEVSGYVAQGYLDGGATPSPFSADGWYRSGDLGSLGEDGMLRFAGRHSDLIRSSGINISPADVEESIRSHPEVDDVVVVGVEHDLKGQIVVALVTVRDGAELTAHDVIAFCRRHISGYKVPAHVEIVEALPLTDTGKLARRIASEAARRVVEPLVAAGQI